ncbi:MAG: lamin tail domain-containing protein [Prolixibacteraceae bacterium]
MIKFLPFLAGLLLSFGALAQTDLFFSEYVEGTGNNKAVEIYNPTNQTIDMTKYYVARFSNGSTDYSTGGIVQLTGTLEPYKTFVLVNGQTTSTESSPAPDAALQALATQMDNPYPAATYMNGNDAIALLKSETGDAADALPVDLIGNIGLGSKIKAEAGWAPFTDTIITYKIGEVEYKHTITDYIIKSTDDTKAAAYGPYWLAWTQDHTLRRKYDVVDGVKENPAQFNVSAEWDTVSVALQGVDELTGEPYTYRSYKDIWNDLGKHACVAETNGGNAVENLIDQGINIFPTLVKQSFTITSTSELIHQVTLFNLRGEQVFIQNFQADHRVQVQLPPLNKGIYVVKTTTDKNARRITRIAIQ